MKILIVDDSKSDLMLISSMLSDYELITANDGVEAMACIENEAGINVMLLDLNMPRMNGFEVLKAVGKNSKYNSIAILILTNYDEVENEILGLELGALDYIRKPLNLRSLRKRIELHGNLQVARHAMEQQNQKLEERVLERTRECNLTRDVTISAMVGLLEIRSIESSNHSKRTQWMMKTLCDYLRSFDPYTGILTDIYVTELFSTSPLHDIGKVSIPDYILLKPERLTFEEFEMMKLHTSYGVKALEYEECGGACPSFIQTAIEIVGTHHEWFDGTGYPYGLKGKDIPLPGRLMAIIDVYDALVSTRVYKPAYSHEVALEIMSAGRGTQFDPDILDAFFMIRDEIKMIAERFVQQRI